MHTADLDRSMLTVLRALLDDAFDGELSDQDWEHALGGMHAVVSGWQEWEARPLP
jgi:aminoglycoside 2'-N-acetyltransferase I